MISKSLLFLTKRKCPEGELGQGGGGGWWEVRIRTAFGGTEERALPRPKLPGKCLPLAEG